MPNGKGALECSYCIHWQANDGKEGYGPGCGGPGRCGRWAVAIPAASGGDHRICADFAPSSDYERDNRGFMEHHGQTVEESVSQRMLWFGIELKRGMLYAFCYNQPPGVRELMLLTEPNADSDENSF